MSVRWEEHYSFPLRQLHSAKCFRFLPLGQLLSSRSCAVEICRREVLSAGN